MNLIELYDNILRHKLSNHITEIFADYNPIDKGSYFVCTCPGCGKQEAFIYKNADRLECNRKNSCEYSTNILSHLNGGTYPKGKDYVNIIKQLCAMTGTSFPEREYSREEIQKFEEREQKQKLLNDFQNILTTALFDENNEAEAYLAHRGFPKDSLRKFEFGFYPSRKYVEEKLTKLGYLPSDIEAAGILRDDWEGRVTYPIRDRRKIGDYWARDITGKVDNSKKYLRMSKSSGSDTSILFGLDNCSSDEIVVVEGYFDALTLYAHGIKNVVALASNKLTDGHLKKLEQSKIKTITLLLDNDNAGADGLLSIINKLKNHAIMTDVIPPELLKNCKDADEYIKAHGEEALKSLFDNRINGFRYLAQAITKKHKDGEWKDHKLAAALDDANKFEKSVTNSKNLLPLDLFWEEFVNQTEINQETVDKYRKISQEEKANIIKKKLIEDCQREINDLIDSGDIDAAADKTHLLSVALMEQVDDQDQNLAKLMIPDSLDEMYDAFSNEIPSIETGYRFTNDLSLFFPAGGISVVAGPTSGGKTTLLMNTTIGALENNPNLTAYFLSYEESAHHIRAKFINIYANVHLNRGNNRGAIFNFFNKGGKEKPDSFKYIIQNKDTFIAKMEAFDDRFLGTGRLKIINNDMTIEKVILAIKYINQQNPNACLFVIDYIQQLEMSRPNSTTPRYAELKDIATMLRKCAVKLKLAIVVGAQLKRDVDDESKLNKNAIADGHGIAKEAEVIYGIWNRSNNDIDPKDEIFIKVIKGRNVKEGCSTALPFDGNTGKIEANTGKIEANEVNKFCGATKSKDDKAKPNFAINSQQKAF